MGAGVASDRQPGQVSWRILRGETAETPDGLVELNPRPRAVLLCLLLDPSASVSTDKIADFVWGDELPKTAANSIARFVADIRKSLGPWRDRVVTTDGGYMIAVQPGERDIDQARALLDEATRLAIVDPERSHSLLVKGLALVGETPNSSLAALSQAAVALRVHEELRIAMLEQYVEVELHRNRARHVIPVLETATVAYPFHEYFWMRLMVALERCDRKVEALRAAQRARYALADVGLDPGTDFKSVEAAIAAGDAVSLTARASDSHNGARVVTETRTRHGIDEPSTSMVGRLGDLQMLESALVEHRVVSIVGIGGAGKTRVAMALMKATEATGATIYRVGLQSAADPELVLPTVAAVLGVPSGGAPTAAALAQAVSHDSFVLLLDNCEHVQQACAELVEALAEAATGVRIVTTSRAALGVANEHVYVLGMLSTPELHEVSADSGAVSLLIDRADAHLRAGASSDAVLPDLCAIAQALGGHPLSIELAAAQLAYMSPRDLSVRIRSVFANKADDQDRPAVALTAVMDWTWDHLGPSLQELLARLSVFGGGWTLAAAEAVCGDGRSIETDLADLSSRGLITNAVTHGEQRYAMLDPARGYAWQRLVDRHELDAMQDRLAEWLMSLASQWTVAEQHIWASPSVALFAERGNVVSALGYLNDQGRIGELAELAIRSSGMWINHGFAEEAKRWLTPILDSPLVPEPTRSAAAAMLLAASHALGELDSLMPLGLQAIELAAGEPFDFIPAVASFLSLWALFNPGAITSDELYELSMTTAEASPSRDSNLLLSSLYQGHVQFCMRQYNKAAQLFGQVRSSTEQAGRLLLVSEIGHGVSLFMAGEHEQARQVVEGWKSHRDTDDWHYIIDIMRAVVLGGTGSATQATADLAAAVRRLQPASVWGRADEIQVAFGLLARFRGEDDLADRLLSTAATRDVLLTVVTVEVEAANRGITDDAGWFDVAQEFWTRVMPENPAFDSASSAPELVNYWLAGESEPIR